MLGAGPALGVVAAATILFALNGGLPRPTQPPRTARIGFMGTSAESQAPFLAGFRAGLRDAGWVEGQNLIIDYRWVEDHPERHLIAAAELVALTPDVLAGGSAPNIAALRHASVDAIPIVMLGVSDPVGGGVIDSLARPGGNVTSPPLRGGLAGTLAPHGQLPRGSHPARSKAGGSACRAPTVFEVRDRDTRIRIALQGAQAVRLWHLLGERLTDAEEGRRVASTPPTQ
jgi:hypothetical protein